MADKIMILAAGPEQVPLIQAARAAGLYTLVVDEDATRPGAALADLHIPLSILDEAGCIEQARRHDISGVTSTALSLGMRTVGAVAEALELPGLRRRTAYFVTDKAAMRERLQQAGIPQARFRLAANLEEAQAAAQAVGHPVVFKPVDASGSRGIRIVATPDEAAQAYRVASAENRTPERRQTVLVEEHVRGIELGSEGFITGGRLVLCTLRRVLSTPPPYCQTLGYDYPCDLSAVQQESIRGYLQQVADALDLNDTPFHCDMMIRPDGTPVVLEIGARLPGFGLAGDFLPLAVGFELFPHAIGLALGCGLALPPIRRQPVSLRFFNLPTGVVAAMVDLDELRALPGVHVLRSDIRTGSRIEPIVDGRQAMHAGYVVVSGDTEQAAVSRAESVAARFRQSLRFADEAPA